MQKRRSDGGCPIAGRRSQLILVTVACNPKTVQNSYIHFGIFISIQKDNLVNFIKFWNLKKKDLFLNYRSCSNVKISCDEFNYTLQDHQEFAKFEHY